MFRKLKFYMIYYAYLNESAFKYYLSILGGVGGLRPRLFCLFRGCGVQNSGKPAYIILARSLVVFVVPIVVDVVVVVLLLEVNKCSSKATIEFLWVGRGGVGGWQSNPTVVEVEDVLCCR